MTGLWPYFALFSARFRTLIQYREAAIAGMATQLFWGLIKIMILEGFYHGTTRTPPMSLAQAVTYTWLGQAFLAMLPFTANPDPDVRNMIRTGAVAYELARPIDLYSLWLSRQFAARTAPTLLRCVPIFLIAVPFLGMGLPPTLASGAAFVVSLAGALWLVCSFMTIITISLLWTISGDGIARLVPSVTLLLSGLIIPLPLFPPALQTFLKWQPFSGVADSPFRLYFGHLPPEALGGVLLHQLAWSLVFVLIGRLLLRRGLRLLTVQGG
ncbi:MAG: ABC-2 family transporter protein [Capsulimonadales bacterium]|nr:ABC-2 family transporter protein [Capsulimonadales bacterium]